MYRRTVNTLSGHVLKTLIKTWIVLLNKLDAEVNHSKRKHFMQAVQVFIHLVKELQPRRIAVGVPLHLLDLQDLKSPSNAFARSYGPRLYGAIVFELPQLIFTEERRDHTAE